MKNSRYLIIAMVAIAAIGIWSWQAPNDAEADDEPEAGPASVEHVEGSELSRVTLTERAAQRLDIQTAPSTMQQEEGASLPVVPYSAVIYDADGNAWTYTSPEPLVFVRAPITIDRIDGDVAILTEGPVEGTMVVTVGGALLFGTEFGVGH